MATLAESLPVPSSPDRLPPNPPPRFSSPPAQEKPRREPVLRNADWAAVRHWAKEAWPVAALVLSVGLSILAGEPRFWALAYVAIILSLWGATELVSRRFPTRRTWTCLAGTMLIAFALFTWGRIDTYKDEWASDTARFTETFHRWTGRHVYRQVDHYLTAEECAKDKWGFDPDSTSEGPMAGTGRPHGMWKRTVGLKHWAEYTKSHLPITQTTFYWYGDEITEGEWHLRNDR